MALGLHIGGCSCICTGYFTIASFDAATGALRYVLDHGANSVVPTSNAHSLAMLIDADSMYEIGSTVLGQNQGTLQKWSAIATTEDPTRTFYSNVGAFSDEATGVANNGDNPNASLILSSDGTRYSGSSTRLSRWNEDTQINQASLSASRFFRRMFESVAVAGEIDVFFVVSVFGQVPVARRYSADLSSFTGPATILPSFATGVNHGIANVRRIPSSGYIVGMTRSIAGGTNYAQLDANLTATGWASLQVNSAASHFFDVTSDSAYIFGAVNHSSGAFVRRYTLPLAGGFGSGQDWSVSLVSGATFGRLIRSSDDQILTIEFEQATSTLYVRKRSAADGSVTWQLALGTTLLFTTSHIYRSGTNIVVASNWSSGGTAYHVALINSAGTLVWQGNAKNEAVSINDLGLDGDGNPYIAVNRATT